jgi:uncharacterized protein (TIGR03086 family)
MDAFATLDRSRVEFRRVLAGVTHEHWELATPCDEWDVRALVNHVLGGNVRYTMLLHGAPPDEIAATRSVDHIGDDALASFDTSAAEVTAAFEETGALERTVHHPAGDRSGLDLLWLRVAEWTIHAWDLARAIGAEERLPSDLVEFVHAFMAPQVDAWRTAGVFAEAVPVPTDADLQSQLLALTGRTP